MTSPKPNLKFILDTLNIIQNNTPGDKSTFMNDLNAQDATLMRLQDIGQKEFVISRAHSPTIKSLLVRLKLVT